MVLGRCCRGRRWLMSETQKNDGEDIHQSLHSVQVKPRAEP